MESATATEGVSLIHFFPGLSHQDHHFKVCIWWGSKGFLGLQKSGASRVGVLWSACNPRNWQRQAVRSGWRQASQPHVFSFSWVSLGTQVPDCFLEIASLTLQEFFRAVSTGKDADPSWKKPIYKIISKLDSDIPEIFKSSSYPQELFRN